MMSKAFQGLCGKGLKESLLVVASTNNVDLDQKYSDRVGLSPGHNNLLITLYWDFLSWPVQVYDKMFLPPHLISDHIKKKKKK